MTFFCPYSVTRVKLKLGRRARGHFVTLIEIRVHLIWGISGHKISARISVGNLMVTSEIRE